ncbi:hypothetical protein [Curtobacterium sp. HSID17257]|uniref:hypothetical protein n=1 Tax=Curtobacterium sp. HSID17257 TaxID=2419510 RepID=UPI000F87A721|nr:hypothetical protein [Curtobacterium sp. HSID17257]RUQ02866.1 hypothetical protein D8M35_13120 [Curtobacterium sp. HSID17257]
MTTLTGALLLLPIVRTGWTAVPHGLVLGAAGGALRGIDVGGNHTTPVLVFAILPAVGSVFARAPRHPSLRS